MDDTAKRERTSRYFMFLFVDYTSSKSMQEMQAVAVKDTTIQLFADCQGNVVSCQMLKIKI